jgi:hypothetical protein
MEKLLRVLEIPVASMKRSWHPVLASALLAGAVTPVVAVGGAVAADGDITPAVLANRDVVLTGDAVVRGPSPVDRARPGSKHHIITDGQGSPLAVSLTGGNRNDVTQLLPITHRHVQRLCQGQ